MGLFCSNALELAELRIGVGSGGRGIGKGRAKRLEKGRMILGRERRGKGEKNRSSQESNARPVP